MNYVQNFDFKASGQVFTAPYAGYYKLEVWGASGGESTINGMRLGQKAFGGYSMGISYHTKNQKDYVYTGGAGGDGYVSDTTGSWTGIGGAGGYNGGGSGTWDENDNEAAGGGGGATHISLDDNILVNLGSHKADDRILIVASGGGGAAWSFISFGGGVEGGLACPDKKAGQDFGYMFGQGENAVGVGGFNEGLGGGGGGWYGGYASNSISCKGGFMINHPAAQHNNIFDEYAIIKDSDVGAPYSSVRGQGGGGSGYIGSSNLISGFNIEKHMTCYSCTISNDANTKTYSNTTIPTDTPQADVVRIGNGYARITWMGDTLN